MPLNAGDVVTLKSGGPRMTVLRKDPHTGVGYECAWFPTQPGTGTHLPKHENAKFPEEALKLMPSPQPAEQAAPMPSGTLKT